MEKIEITKDLRFGFEDLMTRVDLSCEFTLRDILTICINSKINVDHLMSMLHCNYVELYEEMVSKPSDFTEKDEKDEKDENLECLELYWDGGIYEWEGKVEGSQQWSFHGLGKKGVIPTYDTPYHLENLTEEEKINYRTNWAIEFEPMYKIADYPIRISNEMIINDSRKDLKDQYAKIDFAPSITLIELLYWIFWELSFCGDIKGRNDKKIELNDTIKKYEEDKKNGTLITYTFENLKELFSGEK